MDSTTEDIYKPSISKIKGKARVLLFIIMLTAFFRNLGLSIVNIGLPKFIISLSGTLTAYGLVIGAFSITQSIFQFPIASSSDRFGRKKILLIGIALYIVGTFLCYFARDIPQLIIFRAIQGAGAYTSILQAMIGDLFKKGRYGKGMGFYSLSMNSGYFVGIVLGGIISTYLGFRNIFSVSGMLALISGILILFFYNEKKTKIPNNDYNNYENSNTKINFSSLKGLLKRRQFIIIVLLNCIRWFLFGGIVAYLIWILQMHFKLDEIITSLLLLYIVFIYLFFVIFSSRFIDKKGPRKMMLIGQSLVLIFGSTFFYIDSSNNLILFLIIISFIAMGLATYDPSGNTLLLNFIVKIDPNLKGTGLGFNNSIGFFFSALGSIAICSAGEIFILLPFYMIFILILISFITALKLIKSK
ncbi:MAG: MFS transporter [Promethearchaeia archaeon]